MIEEASETAKNISKVIILRILHYPLLLIFVLIIPRMMGAELYGKYAFMFSLLIIMLQFTRFGAEEIFLRFIPEFKIKNEIFKINEILLNFFVFRTIILIIVTIIFSILFYFFTPEGYEKVFFLMIAISLIIRGTSETFSSLLFGLNEIEKYASLDLFRRFLNLILVGVLFYYFGLFGAILAILLISVFLLILAFKWTKEYFQLKKCRFSISFLLPYLKFGFLFYIISGFFIIIKASGNNLIEFFTNNSKEVAFFDISNNIFWIIAQSMFFLFTALIPIFTQLLLKSREDKINKWTSLVLRYNIIISVLIMGSILLIGPEFITIIFGTEYKKVYPNLIILFLGIFPSLIAWVGNIYSIVYRTPKKFLFAKFLSFITFSALSILLIPQYASIGCSVAIIFSMIIEGITMYFQFREKMANILEIRFLKIIISGFVVIPLYFLRVNFEVNLYISIFYIIIYLIILYVFRLFNLDEIKEIIRAIKVKKNN